MAAIVLSRRDWLTRAGIACAGATVPATLRAAQRRGAPAQAEEEDVAPPEDLMREHGVLKRVVLVYDEPIRRIDPEDRCEAVAAA